MAIWQYQIFIVPQKEINSFFKNEMNISDDDLNEIDWWKYEQLNLEDFSKIDAVLPKRKSWTDEIVLFGDDDSNCLKILYDDNRIVEISARLDLRCNYKQFVEIFCEFAEINKCVFLNDELRILFPNVQLVEDDIRNYAVYRDFFKKINSNRSEGNVSD